MATHYFEARCPFCMARVEYEEKEGLTYDYQEVPKHKISEDTLYLPPGYSPGDVCPASNTREGRDRKGKEYKFPRVGWQDGWVMVKGF